MKRSKKDEPGQPGERRAHQRASVKGTKGRTGIEEQNRSEIPMKVLNKTAKDDRSATWTT